MALSRSKYAQRLAMPLGLRKFNEKVKALGTDVMPDLVVSIKGEAILPETVDWFRNDIGCKTALWYPDDPRYFRSLSAMIAPHYDFVFTAARSFVNIYRDNGVTRCFYLPFGCEPSIHKPIRLSEREQTTLSSDICFVGTYSQKRDRIIQRLLKEGLRVSVWGPFWRYFRKGKSFHEAVAGPQIARVYGAAKLVLNVHDDGDIGIKANMRTFEVAGCNSLLVSDNPHELEEHFDLRTEVVGYDSGAQLVERARDFLAASERRSEFAHHAHEHAYREHTYDQRIGLLLKVVG